MRADTLARLTPSWNWQWCDTDESFRGSPRLWRSLAFRIQAGPLVHHVNHQVCSRVRRETYDVIWVDKAVYLWAATTRQLRSRAGKMIHFTPDTAFFANRSRHFRKSASLYDLLVTTKSFELAEYQQLAPADSIHLTTQAYDPALHRANPEVRQKDGKVAFIGLCEPDRERCIDQLLAAGLRVKLGGAGWKRALQKYHDHPHLQFLGARVFGASYADAISRSSFGLGLLSKRFPELHTTRSFEIPACGTALATEANRETRSFFNPDEVVFFDDHAELAAKLSRLLGDPAAIQVIADRGRQRVLEGGFDYATVLSGVMKRLALIA
jgi:spore maturation protein CgeB